jgi:hypothetical protein
VTVINNNNKICYSPLTHTVFILHGKLGDYQCLGPLSRRLRHESTSQTISSLGSQILNHWQIQIPAAAELVSHVQSHRSTDTGILSLLSISLLSISLLSISSIHSSSLHLSSLHLSLHIHLSSFSNHNRLPSGSVPSSSRSHPRIAVTLVHTAHLHTLTAFD